LLAGLPVGEAPAWRDDPKEQTVRGIANSSRWQTEQVLNAVRDLVAFTLQRVNGFVEAHPFQDESGRYFS
jgi:nuclear transport factor 2 (NTF2) superfamily protein